MSKATDDIATIKTKLVNAENDIALMVVGTGQLNAKVATLEAKLAAMPADTVPQEVQDALDDLKATATDLQTQADAAALPFAPPH